MRFILVDGYICVATHFTVDRERETQNIGSKLVGKTTVTVGESITGEMLLFRPDELPEIFKDDGYVKKMQVEFSQDGGYYTMEGVIMTARRPMDDTYEKCEGAYFEYAATDISVSKDISSATSI